jgi:hypothetical protein
MPVVRRFPDVRITAPDEQQKRHAARRASRPCIGTTSMRVRFRQDGARTPSLSQSTPTEQRRGEPEVPRVDELGTSSPDVVSDPAPDRENRTSRSQVPEHAAGPTVDPVGLGVRCLGARMRVGVPPLRSRDHWPQGQSSFTLLLRVRQREASWAAAASTPDRAAPWRGRGSTQNASREPV